MKISPSNESEVEVKQGMKEKGMMNGSSKEVKKKNDVSSILIPSMSSYVDERQGNGPEQIFFCLYVSWYSSAILYVQIYVYGLNSLQ